MSPGACVWVRGRDEGWGMGRAVGGRGRGSTPRKADLSWRQRVGAQIETEVTLVPISYYVASMFTARNSVRILALPVPGWVTLELWC